MLRLINKRVGWKMREASKWLKLVCLCLFITLSFPAGVRSETHSESYEYMSAVISSLSKAKETRDVFKAFPKGTDTREATAKTWKAIIEFQNAREAIAPFKESKNETIASSQKMLDIVFVVFIGVLEKDVDLMEKVKKLSAEDYEKEAAAIAKQYSFFGSQVDQFWRELVKAAALSTLSLRDMTREVGGSYPYATITASEKDALLQDLGRSFGDEIKAGIVAGQHGSVAAPASIWMVLTKSDVRASDRRKIFKN